MTRSPDHPITRFLSFLRRRFSREEAVGLYLTLGFLASALLIGLFGSLAGEVFEKPGLPIDPRVTRAVRGWQTERRTDLAETLTILGDYGFLIPATLAGAGTLALRRHRISALLFAGSVFGGFALNSVLKIAFRRARPDLWPALVTERTYSFPSGHATLSTVFFGGIVALVFHLSKSHSARAASAAGAAVIVAVVAFTRIYLGAHWLTDVLAGILLGLVWVIVCATGTELLTRRRASRES
jgi:undecaprenyl-diphosphatase